MSVIQLSWSALSHVGRFRKNNEDSFLALQVDGYEVHRLGKEGGAALADHDFVFVVSDGMGGANAGEFASRIAVDRIVKRVPPAFRLAARGLNAGFSDVLEALIDDIHHDIVSLGQSYEECRGMGATLSLAWVHPQWLYFAHVGDSRIYHIPRDRPMLQVTRDHTHVGWLMEKGEINEREARSHPRRNMLQQALGGRTQFLSPHIGAVSYEPGDAFLLCTDGLIDGIWNRRLEELVRKHAADTDRSRAEVLVKESVESSGRDNTTAVLIYVD